MSTQAWVVAVVMGLCTLLSTIIMINGKTPATLTTVLTFISLFTVAIITYDTHCLTAGYCDVWSWVRTILYCILPVIMIIILSTSLFSKPSDSPSSQPTSTHITIPPPAPVVVAPPAPAPAPPAPAPAPPAPAPSK